MSTIQEKNINESDLTLFDDTMLPVSRISAEDSDRLESILAPLLEEELKKLRNSKPYLFVK